MALGNYQFLKYKRDSGKKNTLRKIEIYSQAISEERLAKSDEEKAISEERLAKSDKSAAISPFDSLNIVNEAVYKCRDLINEPASYLTATVFSKEIEKIGKDCGAKVEVMNKKKLEALQMGGILGVNKGSYEPPHLR